ncbi:MAG: 50S ribosomal protein L6 [Thermoleophilia bacterium]|nr:50S ribosomal protein L6 [Thermoleophilia bacterium]
MSRIGKLPITLPAGVEVSVAAGNVVTVKGPKGSLDQQLDADMTVVVEDGSVVVQRPSDRPRHKALHGLSRSLLQNMVTGVTEGYEKRLEIVGVGYRFVAKGKDVDLSAGFSHPVVLTPPDGIEFKVENQTEMAIVGIDKQLVGQTASKIRELRPPEPYKGKGIKYKGEHIRRKIGKRAQ